MKAIEAVILLLAELYWRFFAPKPVSVGEVKEAIDRSVKGDSGEVERIISRGVDS